MGLWGHNCVCVCMHYWSVQGFSPGLLLFWVEKQGVTPAELNRVFLKPLCSFKALWFSFSSPSSYPSLYSTSLPSPSFTLFFYTSIFYSLPICLVCPLLTAVSCFFLYSTGVHVLHRLLWLFFSSPSFLCIHLFSSLPPGDVRSDRTTGLAKKKIRFPFSSPSITALCEEPKTFAANTKFWQKLNSCCTRGQAVQTTDWRLSFEMESV